MSDEGIARSKVPGSPVRRPRWRVPWWVQLVLSVVLIALSIVLLLPLLPEGERAIDTLRRLSLPLMLAGLMLEAASLTAYSAMSILIFRTPNIRFRTLLRIDLTVTGVSHAVPAGGATAAALRLQLLHRAGLSRSEAISGEAVQATAANLVLGCLFLIGLIFLISTGGDAASYVIVASVVCAALVAAGALAWLLLHPSERLADWARALTSRLPRLLGRGYARAIHAVTIRLTDLIHHPSRTSRVLACSALNWLLDATVLWVMLAAVGEHLSVGPLLTVYGLGSILAILPLTPGGLGIVEGVMIPSLVGLGIPSASALIAVLGWRLWQFWIPIPVAGLCYLSLWLGERRGRKAIGETVEDRRPEADQVTPAATAERSEER